MDKPSLEPRRKSQPWFVSVVQLACGLASPNGITEHTADKIGVLQKN